MGRSRFCCWLQTAQIPSLFVGLDAEHQQFVDVLLGLADQLPQLGDFPIQGRLAEGPGAARQEPSLYPALFSTLE